MEVEEEEESLIVAYLAPSENGRFDNTRSNIGENVLLDRLIAFAVLLLCRRPVVLSVDASFLKEKMHFAGAQGRTHYGLICLQKRV